jgi:hypothetical protein
VTTSIREGKGIGEFITVLLSVTTGKGSTKGKHKASKDLSAGGKKHVRLDVDIDIGNFEVINGKHPYQLISIINSMSC